MLLLTAVAVDVCEDLQNGVVCIPARPCRSISYLGASRRVVTVETMEAQWRKMGHFLPLLRSDPPHRVVVKAILMRGRLPDTEIVGAKQEGMTLGRRERDAVEIRSPSGGGEIREEEA
ncbi:hypothetical protein E2562_036388 [Oryza meyeriana var. granulata]|uniref:Uncharacterized protein n=1 Tax=Oryza meyeriana var. granulata TaxID=110450 RepID=A0A6G1F229_9ORYZ|nr:hypothetical protein E2562_036388 [Oryza meyeriana var. granulata]